MGLEGQEAPLGCEQTWPGINNEIIMRCFMTRVAGFRFARNKSHVTEPAAKGGCPDRTLAFLCLGHFGVVLARNDASVNPTVRTKCVREYVLGFGCVCMCFLFFTACKSHYCLVNPFTASPFPARGLSLGNVGRNSAYQTIEMAKAADGTTPNPSASVPFAYPPGIERRGLRKHIKFNEKINKSSPKRRAKKQPTPPPNNEGKTAGKDVTGARAVTCGRKF